MLIFCMFSCNKEKTDTDSIPSKHDIKFISKISNEEIMSCKASFSQLRIKSKNKIMLDYGKFKTTISQGKLYAKFFFLSDQDSLTLGLAFSDSDTLDYRNDDLYILSGKEFIKDSTEFRKKMLNFNTFKARIAAITKHVPSEVIVYKVDDINTYFKEMDGIAGQIKYNIESLQFEYIYFKDFIRADGTLIDYDTKKDSKISFAVKTNFSNPEKGGDKFLSQSILDFYYDAGDLKP